MNKLTIDHISKGVQLDLFSIMSKPNIIREENKPIIRALDGSYYHLLSIIPEITLIRQRYGDDLIDYFTKYHQLPIHDGDIDMSYGTRLFRDSLTKNQSGSSSTNGTYIYCFDLIKPNILNIFKNITNKTKNVTIILPTLTSTIIKHIIYLFAFIAKDISLIKTGDWLKDSFIAKITDIDTVKLNQIKQDINRLNNLNEIDTIINIRQLDDRFNNQYLDFVLLVSAVIYDLWNNIIKSITNSPTSRNDKFWQNYDKLLHTK